MKSLKFLLFSSFFLSALITRDAFSVDMTDAEWQKFSTDVRLFSIISNDNDVGALQLSDRAKDSGSSTGSVPVGGRAADLTSAPKMRREITYDGVGKVNIEELLKALLDRKNSYQGLDLSPLLKRALPGSLPDGRLTYEAGESSKALRYLAILYVHSRDSGLLDSFPERQKDLLIAAAYMYQKLPLPDNRRALIESFCIDLSNMNVTKKALQYVVTSSSEQEYGLFYSNHKAFLKACGLEYPAVCPKNASAAAPPTGTQYAGASVTIPSDSDVQLVKSLKTPIERAQLLEKIYAEKIHPEFIKNFFKVVIEVPAESGITDLVSLTQICGSKSPDLFKDPHSFEWRGTLAEQELQDMCSWVHFTFSNPERFMRSIVEMDQEIQGEEQKILQKISELSKKEWSPAHNEFLRRIAEAARGGRAKEEGKKDGMLDAVAKGLRSAGVSIRKWWNTPGKRAAQHATDGLKRTGLYNK